MKKRTLLILSITLTMLTVFGKGPCEKCDINMVKLTHEKMANLTFDIVQDFLCTFDKVCINNVEFSEWSNEVLFSVLIKEPNLFLQVMEKGKINAALIISEIENPIHDLINLQTVYNKIKGTSYDTELKRSILKTVIKAANNFDEKIVK
jgi:hypothetical protein